MGNLQKLRVLIYREHEMWIAQTLESDFCSQGRTISEVLSRLEQMIVSYLVICEEEGIEPFSDMEPVPEEFFKRFEAAELVPRNVPASFELHHVPAEVRAAA